MAVETVPDWLCKLLNEESFLKNHSHYMGVRLNHKAHGIYALYYLGATQEFIQKYVDNLNNIVPALNEDEEFTEPLEIDFIKSDKLEDYIGRNQAYYKMLSMFTKMYKEKYNSDILQMVKDVCADKLDGPLYNAFHSIIHLCYGYLAGSHQVMLEAITLGYHQYSPVFFNSDPGNPKKDDLSRFGNGNKSLLDVLQDLQQNKQLIAKIYENNVKDMQLRKETNMYGVYNWSGIRYHSEEFIDYTDSIKFPDFFDKEKKDMGQFKKLLEWYFDMTVVGFVSSERPNDFFVLHGVTSAWAAMYIFPLFGFDVALKNFRAMIAAFLMTYCLQHAPALSKKPDDFIKGEVNEKTWKDFIDSLYKKPVIFETHVYKMVQITYEAWKRNPKSEFARHYFAAASSCVNNNFLTRDGSLPNTSE